MSAAVKLDTPIPFTLGPRAGTLASVASAKRTGPKVDYATLRRQVLDASALRGRPRADVEDAFGDLVADPKLLAQLDAARTPIGFAVTFVKRWLADAKVKHDRQGAIEEAPSVRARQTSSRAGGRIAEPAVEIDRPTLSMVRKLRGLLEAIAKGAEKGQTMTPALREAVRASFQTMIVARSLDPDQVAAVVLDDVLDDVLTEDTKPHHLRAALMEHSDGATTLEVLAWFGAKRGAETVDDPDGNADRALQYLAEHARVGGAGGRGARGAKSINVAVLAVMNSVRKAWGLSQWRTPEAAGLRPRRRNSRK